MEAAEEYGIYEDGRHYDLMFPGTKAGMPFWQEEAEAVGGKILELACGTGRVCIPLARAGFDITGIDLSSAMLREAKQKTQSEGLTARWIEGDIRRFQLDTKYDLIILTGNTLCHLLDLDSVEACLSCVRDHLASDGRFIVTVFVPDPKLLQRRCDERLLFAEYQDPNGRGKVTVTHTYTYEPDTQIKRIATYHRFEDSGEEITGALNMRMFFPQEIDALLKYNGFRIVHKWGDVDRRPFDADSTQQLIVCRRTRICQREDTGS